MDEEFDILRPLLTYSGCPKRQVAAGCYSDRVGEGFIARANYCRPLGGKCKRQGLHSGSDYGDCCSTHAEIALANYLEQHSLKIGREGIVWVFGHYWACEPCAARLVEFGAQEIRVRSVPVFRIPDRL